MSDLRIVLQGLDKDQSIGENEYVSATIIGPKEDVLDMLDAGMEAVDGEIHSVTKTY